VEDAIRELQLTLEQSERLMYMKRVKPFLVSMQQFGEVSEAVRVFSDVRDIMSLVWVSALMDIPFEFCKDEGLRVITGFD
jgi:hypothetical protein